jgi:sigma54-dependent transcription regulator
MYNAKILDMSSLYENELTRLLKEKQLRLESLQGSSNKKKEVNKIKEEIGIIEMELEKYSKAMERFRIKPNQVNNTETKST